HEIVKLIDEQSTHIVLVTEPPLTNNALNQINGTYDIFTPKLIAGSNARVGVVVSKDLEAAELFEYSSRDMIAITIRVQEKQVVIVSFYADITFP
ncbi:Hypothetical protein FKW44_021055, partial [Caligus rogercresseyi]